jgi:hypothetical protein
MDPSILNDKEWEDDNVHFCECGEKKNPSFKKCFVCMKQEQVELDEWVRDLQYKSQGFDKKPF